VSDGNVAFEKGVGVLHIGLTVSPRLPYMRLADALAEYFAMSLKITQDHLK